MSQRSANHITLAIFAPLLIVVGVAGFLIPAHLSLTSGAPAYNVFHICFGLLGLLVLWARKERWLSLFNAGFGLIDLFQALASYTDLTPKQYFRWTRVDDILHVVIGLTLFLIGCYGLVRQRN